MKTWKKILGFTALTGIALGGLAYFAKKKSMEDDFAEDFDDTFDIFEDDLEDNAVDFDDQDIENKNSDRTYVSIDLESQEAVSEEDLDAPEETETNEETE